MAATEPMGIILEQHSLATLQFLVLLGVHGQRSPYGAGAWSQIRYATSVCIEMGLHRKQTQISSVAQARDIEIRRRIFWSCYCLDRATSIVLGRAFAIADRDINVEVSGKELYQAIRVLTRISYQAPAVNSGLSPTAKPAIHLKVTGRTLNPLFISSSLIRSIHESTRLSSESTRTSSTAHSRSERSLIRNCRRLEPILMIGCAIAPKVRKRATKSPGCTTPRARTWMPAISMECTLCNGIIKCSLHD